jgi:hypothetical protein
MSSVLRVVDVFQVAGRFGGGGKFGEYVLRHPDAIKLFNGGIAP